MASARKQQKEDEVVDEEDVAALDQIKACQTKINGLNNRASEEVIEVAKKYYKQLKPFYKKRNDEIKRIPNFWTRVLINHPVIAQVLNEDDEECLNFLSKLEVEEFKDISGYRIHFHFDENPYFENTTLTKEICFSNESASSSKSTPITWKEGIDLLKTVEQNIEPKRSSDYNSFFAWFLDNSNPDNDNIGEILKDDVWLNPLMYFAPATNLKSENDEEL